ncbi:MAG: efflux RND transporter permease subunit [Hyphomonadaceae bacterium]|jgi:hypothetical protein|nr:efflux RND transporter permease subunit [Hyphomonadaceae bacterium]
MPRPRKDDTRKHQLNIRFTPREFARVPVLMTASTASLALIPLVLAAGQPGREILHPVAVVIFSGLFSSTLLDLVLRPLIFWRFARTPIARRIPHAFQSATRGERP